MAIIVCGNNLPSIGRSKSYGRQQRFGVKGQKEAEAATEGFNRDAVLR